MKKFLILLLVLIVVGGVAVVTCPDRQAHKDAMMSVVNEIINEEITPEKNGEGMAVLGAALGSSIVEYALDKHLSVKNHFVYSEGFLMRSSGPERLSVGVFGHVFTFSKDDLDKLLEEVQ